MKRAILYIRVSTDEQADKGYSQRDQDERLKIYCERNNILVDKIIFEDYSAKTFDRPQWIRLLTELKRTKGKNIDLILFTKWDRFSRNTADAYGMIKTLKALQVEPVAIEQPLDISVPESKVILAIYLAVPEVDNDRRALNTINGMRRAKKEGRWMATAPIGYKNKITETGRKYIAPVEPAAGIMRWSFEELAKGVLGLNPVWKIAKEMGLNTTRNNFQKLIRHPVYCGKIIVGAYKDEERKIVQGQHDPIVSESLFYRVQDIIDGRHNKGITGQKNVVNEAIPLKGFLICPTCNSKLLASASKGCRQYYHYYHCTSSCGFRVNANKVNDLFIDELKRFSLEPAVAGLYEEVVRDVFEQETGTYKRDVKTITQQINELAKRKMNAREMRLVGDLDGDEFHEIKDQCEKKIADLESRLASLNSETPDVSAIIPKAVSNLQNLHLKYREGTIEVKREIISSIFPENIVFEKNNFRTIRLNSVIGLIYSAKADFRQKKARKSIKNDAVPRWVTWERLELSTH